MDQLPGAHGVHLRDQLRHRLFDHPLDLPRILPQDVQTLGCITGPAERSDDALLLWVLKLVADPRCRELGEAVLNLDFEITVSASSLDDLPPPNVSCTLRNGLLLGAALENPARVCKAVCVLEAWEEGQSPGVSGAQGFLKELRLRVWVPEVHLDTSKLSAAAGGRLRSPASPALAFALAFALPPQGKHFTSRWTCSWLLVGHPTKSGTPSRAGAAKMCHLIQHWTSPCVVVELDAAHTRRLQLLQAQVQPLLASIAYVPGEARAEEEEVLKVAALHDPAHAGIPGAVVEQPELQEGS
mmetsp:Transcript_73237/g.214707  ORF Transcript_73237/g.214707 Transcript_73237/m.214707 type:complete len:298 (+) Transcript_73237:2485-3378(+)